MANEFGSAIRQCIEGRVGPVEHVHLIRTEARCELAALMALREVVGIHHSREGCCGQVPCELCDLLRELE